MLVTFLYYTIETGLIASVFLRAFLIAASYSRPYFERTRDEKNQIQRPRGR